MDGNSISANYYTSIGTLDNHLMLVEPPASRAGVTHSCWATSRHKWSDLISGAGQVDAAWVEGGPLNVLFAWEISNSAFNAPVQTSAQIIAQIQTYIDGRLALHPWKILIGQSIPRGGTTTFAANNAVMQEVDAHLPANWETMGGAGFMTFRDHPAYNHDGTTAAPFNAYLDYWQEKTAGNFIHLTDTGKSPDQGTDRR